MALDMDITVNDLMLWMIKDRTQRGAPGMYYMNIETGSVDTYDGWYYDDNGNQVNAVDRGEVVPVRFVDGEYREVKE